MLKTVKQHQTMTNTSYTASVTTISRRANRTPPPVACSDFPVLFTDKEFEDVQRQRRQAELATQDKHSNSEVILKTMPHDGRPESTLEQRFAHVTKQLTGMWPSSACSMYLERLIISDRGSRQGFPPDVVDDLIMLFQINEMLCSTPRAARPGDSQPSPRAPRRPDGPTWSSVRKR